MCTSARGDHRFGTHWPRPERLLARAPSLLGVSASTGLSTVFPASSPSSWSHFPLRQLLRRCSSPRAHERAIADKALMAFGSFSSVPVGPSYPVLYCCSSGPPSSRSRALPCPLSVARALARRARRRPARQHRPRLYIAPPRGSRAPHPLHPTPSSLPRQLPKLQELSSPSNAATAASLLHQNLVGPSPLPPFHHHHRLLRAP